MSLFFGYSFITTIESASVNSSPLPQAVVMPVLDNPVVCRLMHDYQLRIVLLNRDDVRSLQDKVFVP
jgi:hypothetical protein